VAGIEGDSHFAIDSFAQSANCGEKNKKINVAVI
jgi:hypothetical protein